MEEDLLYECNAALARAIKLIGDSALRTNAENLVSLAHNVAGATVVAGVDAPRTNLVAAATGLELALRDTTARSTAVVLLRKAAADLECAIGAEIGVVRDAAAELASLLCERQDGEMRVTEEATERQEVAQSDRWWSLIWGRKRHRHMEDDIHAHLLESKQAARIQQLEDSAHSFLTSVGKLGGLHDHDEIMGVVGALEEAVNALQYGGFTNSKLIINAAKAATDVEIKLGDYIIALRDPAATVLRECQRHLDGQKAMAAVLRADTEMTQRREQAQRSDTWWRFRWLGLAMLSCIGLTKALGTVVKEEKMKLFNECIFVVLSLCITLVTLCMGHAGVPPP